jgi:hypothetical protein
MSILVLGIIGLVSVIVHTSRANAVNRENLQAMRAGEKKIEEIASVPFLQIFSSYRTGGNPGPAFKYPDPALGPISGTVKFPVDAGGTLSELATGAFMGMGGNFDMDGVAGLQADVSATYQILPVEIELTWPTIAGGMRTVSYRHILFNK